MPVCCEQRFCSSVAYLFAVLNRIDDIEDNSQLRRGNPGTAL